MCGLCGVYGHIGLNEKKFFKQLQMHSQLRGLDSSGVGLVYTHHKRPPKVLTSLGGQESLVLNNQDDFDADDWLLRDNNLACVVGHHRSATIGAVNIENAHPFDFSNIIGCHNGTVRNTYTLDTFETGNTDSQNILRSINDEVEDVKGTVEFLTGAWALVWYHKGSKDLHILRNEQRTLFTMATKDGRTMFWASELWMLIAAAHRSTLIMEEKAKEVKENKYLVWTKGKKGVLELTSSETVKGGKTKPFIYGTGSYVPPPQYPERYGGYTPPEYVQKALPNNSTNVTEFTESYARTIAGVWINKRTFMKKVECGCTYCSTPILWKDRNDITWFDQNYPVCKVCEDGNQEMIDKATATGSKVVN